MRGIYKEFGKKDSDDGYGKAPGILSRGEESATDGTRRRRPAVALPLLRAVAPVGGLWWKALAVVTVV